MAFGDILSSKSGHWALAGDIILTWCWVTDGLSGESQNLCNVGLKESGGTIESVVFGTQQVHRKSSGSLALLLCTMFWISLYCH